VESFKELQVIVNHFDRYPLVTSKVSDYLIFRECFEIIKQREHLTERGILKLIGLKSSLNWGLSDNLKNAFPNVAYVNKPEYKFNQIPNPFWVSGFTSGDGSFHLNIKKTSNRVSRVSVRYSINLNIKDIEVLKDLASYFNSLKKPNDLVNKLFLVPPLGSTHLRKKVNISNKTVSFQVTKISDLIEVIIPFFEKYPIQGVKSLDFLEFKKVAILIRDKKHLSIEGFNKILEIKLNMNKYREW